MRTFLKLLGSLLVPSPALGTAQVAIMGIVLSDIYRDWYVTLGAMIAVTLVATVLQTFWPSDTEG